MFFIARKAGCTGACQGSVLTMFTARVQAMLAGYTPLGGAACPLFARKFREEDALNFLVIAQEYLTVPQADLALQKANR